MRVRVRFRWVSGFSLIELMTAMAIFLIISAVAFTLLGLSQKRYQSDSQALNSFQEARLGLDQIVRDVNSAGYPPINQFQFGPSTPPVNEYVTSPFAWPNYLSSPPCQIGLSCTSTPSDFDLIVETRVPGQSCPNNGVSWIRYQLVGTTLYRGATCKSSGASIDPDSESLGAQMAPFVQNVVNNVTGQIPQFQAAYPTMFPGGAPVPIFQYLCDTDTAVQSCLSVPAYNSPKNIRNVRVTLMVEAPMPDAQTGRPMLVELQGLGMRTNPNR